MDVCRNFVDGVWTSSSSEETLDVVDPARAEPIARIPSGSRADVDAAVSAASAAAEEWARAGVAARAGALRAVGARLAGHVEDLARVQSREMGQPIKVSREWIGDAVSSFDTYSDLGIELLSAPVHLEGESGKEDYVLREPYGVAALVVPWNFPVAMTLEQLAGLLIAGNTVVLKPSEKSPLSAIRIVELLDLPAGVVNLVLGDHRAGQPLVAHPGVDLVSFTGSVATGRRVAVEAAERLRPSLLELGGKDPAIVDAGVDPRWAAEQIAEAAFLNTGQICTSAERIYVHKDVADRFTEELAALARSETVGDPLDEATTIGPLVDERQRSIVRAHVEAAVARGAKIVAGGEVPDRPGYFYPPTVLTDVTDDMEVMTEETFGPVAPVRVVDSFDEALELAKRTEYGLAATVLTHDEGNASRAAREIPAAIVWVNEWQRYAPGAEFEPAKSSGLGHTGDVAFVRSVTKPKYVHVSRLG